MIKTTLNIAPAPLKAQRPFYQDLTFQVVAGMVLGVLLGALAPDIGKQLKPLGDIFIRLIQMVVGLIIFCTVTHGIASVRDLGKVARIAIKAMVYFEVVTSIALVLGLVTINLLKPGVGMHIDPALLHTGVTTAKDGAAAVPTGAGDFLVNLVPNSAIEAFAKGDILQILVFSVLFACGLASLGEKAQPVLHVVDTVQSALFWIIRQVMKIAPIAAFGAIAFTVAQFGLATLLPLGALILEFLLTCVLFFALVLAPISAYAGFNLLKLMRYFREELVLVLGTSSSESVFPQLTAKLTRLGVNESVVGMVLPTAYSFNHDGTCLYFAAVAVFLAQATGTALGWEQQLGLLAILLLTSKGGAGVSGSAIAVLTLTLAATKTIPVNSIALILGIHRILSAMFVFTNIAGNCVATVVVGHWEKAVNRETLRQELDTGYQPA
ncbi:C4-dicarboxylate transporter DctA [Luteibacter rhizovicinus DSM 16549]|uniref:C4-dicarboxylate transporter DctA n=1 Tax=Luteibacter rhizovicinus DSM 16549 TaxID=1440763 RepID=A0A0G9HEI9_9GAMM|nr:cation:dicarboxylase symporter family transporter [Luteibacter rhizovicinus]APG05333.1 C4-dicarboxylate transporter DctA [Luteibacter rhizovicinus DSM 16549]KLD67956.1 C4-dicarboxylate transporter [Luteibacter rhizovicinus DSM 16549]KLD74037.1 C4-dicarboxylate transporter [Xanthomonas hyacinthi DSM 19077]